MFKLLFKWSLPAFAMAMLTFGWYHMVHSQQKFAIPKSTPPAAPARSPFGKSVAASGIIEPRTEKIAVGSALSGVILEVNVPADKVGQRVRAGDALFRVDDRQLKAQLGYHEANLVAAQAQLAKLAAMPRPEELPPSLAKIRVQEANVRLLEDQYERGKKLIGSNSIGIEEQIGREWKYRTAEQQLQQARDDHKLLLAGAWAPDKAIAQAAVAQANAQVEQTKIEIERATVRAPVDGNVLQVNVRPGEFVGASPNQSLMVLGDMEVLHVRVDIDEHDISRFRSDAAAKAYVRGDGNREVELSFVRVEPLVIPKKSLTGDNTERVDTRVLQVIYALKPTETQVYVGQQLDIFIHVGVDQITRR